MTLQVSLKWLRVPCRTWQAFEVVRLVFPEPQVRQILLEQPGRRVFLEPQALPVVLEPQQVSRLRSERPAWGRQLPERLAAGHWPHYPHAEQQANFRVFSVVRLGWERLSAWTADC